MPKNRQMASFHGKKNHSRMDLKQDPKLKTALFLSSSKGRWTQRGICNHWDNNKGRHKEPIAILLAVKFKLIQSFSDLLNCQLEKRTQMALSWEAAQCEFWTTCGHPLEQGVWKGTRSVSGPSEQATFHLVVWSGSVSQTAIRFKLDSIFYFPFGCNRNTPWLPPGWQIWHCKKPKVWIYQSVLLVWTKLAFRLHHYWVKLILRHQEKASLGYRENRNGEGEFLEFYSSSWQAFRFIIFSSYADAQYVNFKNSRHPVIQGFLH